jgi:hypothetical protein
VSSPKGSSIRQRWTLTKIGPRAYKSERPRAARSYKAHIGAHRPGQCRFWPRAAHACGPVPSPAPPDHPPSGRRSSMGASPRSAMSCAGCKACSDVAEIGMCSMPKTCSLCGTGWQRIAASRASACFARRHARMPMTISTASSRAAATAPCRTSCKHFSAMVRPWRPRRTARSCGNSPRAVSRSGAKAARLGAGSRPAAAARAAQRKPSVSRRQAVMRCRAAGQVRRAVAVFAGSCNDRRRHRTGGPQSEIGESPDVRPEPDMRSA